MVLQNLVSFFPITLHKEANDLVHRFHDTGFSGASNCSAKTFFIGDILRKTGCFPCLLWITNDHTEAEYVYKMVEKWLPYRATTFNFENNSTFLSSDKTKVKILELIYELEKTERQILILPYKSLLYPFPSKRLIIENSVTITRNNSRQSVTEFFQVLIRLGYKICTDNTLNKGEYLRIGDTLNVYPVNSECPISIDLDFDRIGDVYELNLSTQARTKKLEKTVLYPLNIECKTDEIASYFQDKSLVVFDELEVVDELYDQWKSFEEKLTGRVRKISFTAFLEDEENHFNLHYTPVLQFRSAYDFVNDLKEKRTAGWMVIMFTKHTEKFKELFNDNAMIFTLSPDEFRAGGTLLVACDKEDSFPFAFQNPREKILVLSDREFPLFKEEKQTKNHQKVYLDFLTSLKINDYVVHVDYGIAQYQGLERKAVDGVTREYLRLAYAENDKLFVPIDQAEKVTKFIGSGEQVPRLTRLGSTEWTTITNRVRKETQKIAKELLQLYAERAQARGFAFTSDDDLQRAIESTFPYEETPGQIRAILDVKHDMEMSRSMDRLVCGDVGFGKTEVALRASVKAARSAKQVAFISPITILADQHYRTFTSRLRDFPIQVEMLSRFRSKSDQKKILKDLADGKIDIIIGTHRLLQDDVKFHDLGLVIIDEEQRFGVKQKEQFKKMRTEVDIVTLTATPIPRTLNISLNRLRDITIINTPPPGRLPVITEVRRYSDSLIREVILKEIDRKGQIYFLHNRVQTIDSMASRLSALVPEARFIVAHGKLVSSDLEERIIAFKEGQYDVLVSSTIIENGIDLPNANTLIVNNADKFGLAQLYQLRGRVGRSRTQAYAYFLYHSQRLRYEAKKRLRAIVEASELGSGFQIAMKDLEIRGAGDILGANQHGAINVVGVSHFVRMLNQAVEDLKAGKKAETKTVEDVSVELPLACFIPDHYIVSVKEKVTVYQKLSSADTKEYLDQLRDELIEEYGKLPKEVSNLFRILRLKILAKQAHLLSIKAENIHSEENKEIVLTMSDKVRPENIMNLLEHNAKWLISGTKLKIKTRNLGVQWFEELKESIKHLAVKRKPSSFTQPSSNPPTSGTGDVNISNDDHAKGAIEGELYYPPKM